MKIPNGTNAYIDPNKIEGYCLNKEHNYGKHKARVFESVLGLTAENAALLHEALMKAVQSDEAVVSFADKNGQRYVIDFELIGPNQKTAVIHSVWNIRPHEDFPRLITAYVL